MGNKRGEEELCPSPRPQVVQEAGEAGSNILLSQVQPEPTTPTNQTKVSPAHCGKC